MGGEGKRKNSDGEIAKRTNNNFDCYRTMDASELKRAKALLAGLAPIQLSRATPLP
ncbi:uncharacterized protein ANIA_11491 [Aspergillus nidulans FGSC A4]|uniref:Uncharacterized protein n=1 Tax=Emericella nidulans (strain FGSC A4 / ATCC 38163 / CBS 112.46 / NRRL 194 / M139) TaxID=227321 RepID=C8V025_EMENI|nr:hypothetical protein [Aspergillus nidulans FGSC A4]CBF70743.1 TPA: hypothetical protein ANIA_11491 [Aspergillus nidulans FGSC A4]